jgi:hypothetical protein
MTQDAAEATPLGDGPSTPVPVPPLAPTPIPTRIVEQTLVTFAAEVPNAEAIVAALRPVLLSDGGPDAEAILAVLRPQEVPNEIT